MPFKVPEIYRYKNHPILKSDYSFGNNGFFVIPHEKISDYEYRVQASDGLGWEHCSVTVSRKKENPSRCPTWGEMCFIKNLFWGEEETVIQYHPSKNDYVNCHPFCLHLWKPVNIFFPKPVPELVGPKK